MKLSKRLRAVAGLVTEGASVADIGTDHGYIPIYLVEEGISPKVIALDINRGPLERAEIHIREHGLEKQIETRLSDGLSAVGPKEAEVMIAAGIGGSLLINILTEGSSVVESLQSCVLQPQSEVYQVRRYLVEHGFRIVKEDMVKEDGKYYPMMLVVPKGHTQSCSGEGGASHSEMEYRYGKRLLEARHPVLLAYLRREKRIKEEILKKLESQTEPRAKERRNELAEELKLVEEGMKLYAV